MICYIVVFKYFKVYFPGLVVWEDLGEIVLVHKSYQFTSHMAGNPHLEPVGQGNRISALGTILL